MKYAVAGLLCLSLLAGGGYFYWTTTPEYSMNQIGHSVKTKNKALFESHVDIRRITDTMVDEVTQMTTEEMSKSKNTLAVFGTFMATQLLNSMKPQVENLVENEINKLFENEREVASKHSKNAFKEFESSAKVLLVNSYEKKDCSDQICYFSISFEHKLTHKKFDLVAKLEKNNDSWKLVELVDFVKNIKKANS